MEIGYIPEKQDSNRKGEHMDGTATKQNTEGTQNSPAASVTAQETPKAPTTFTEEQVQARVTKAQSDALAAAGRTAKQLEAKERALREWEEKKIQDERERELKELEEAQDKPELLPVIQRKQRLAADIRAHNERVSQFEKQKADYDAKIANAEAIGFEATVSTIAKKYSVKPDTLKDLGITDVGVLEKIASQMKPIETVTPDSGKTVGGGTGTFTEEQISDRAFWEANKVEILKAQKEGRIIRR
jgi:hypothetical protein